MGVPFPVLAGMVLVLINNLVIIWLIIIMIIIGRYSTVLPDSLCSGPWPEAGFTKKPKLPFAVFPGWGETHKSFYLIYLSLYR
jgi:hypothetical protein